ncbi:hypothetical protein BDZ97DRAFT_1764070 [Flammula alnicola]|nr:hypothetical protein BDZ97DRAFT_1764070 [Flammula alnicola]
MEGWWWKITINDVEPWLMVIWCFLTASRLAGKLGPASLRSVIEVSNVPRTSTAHIRSNSNSTARQIEFANDRGDFGFSVYLTKGCYQISLQGFPRESWESIQFQPSDGLGNVSEKLETSTNVWVFGRSEFASQSRHSRKTPDNHQQRFESVDDPQPPPPLSFTSPSSAPSHKASIQVHTTQTKLARTLNEVVAAGAAAVARLLLLGYSHDVEVGGAAARRLPLGYGDCPRWKQQQQYDGCCCSDTTTTSSSTTAAAQIWRRTCSAAAQPLLLLGYAPTTSRRRRRRGDSSSTTAAAARMGDDNGEVGGAARVLLLLGYGYDEQQHDRCCSDMTTTSSSMTAAARIRLRRAAARPLLLGYGYDEQQHDRCCSDTTTIMSSATGSCSDTATMITRSSTTAAARIWRRRAAARPLLGYDDDNEEQCDRQLLGYDDDGQQHDRCCCGSAMRGDDEVGAVAAAIQ